MITRHVTGCHDCPFSQAYDMCRGYFCKMDSAERFIGETEKGIPKTPNWCPLKKVSITVKMQEKRILTQNDMTSREIMQHPAMEGLDEGEKQKLTVLALAFQNLEKDKPIPFSDLRVRVKRRDDHNPETRSTK